MKTISLQSPGEECSYAIGRKIGENLEPGDILALWGELGAGKTFLTRAIAHGLGVPASTPVTSPTFAIINEYDGRLHLCHIDLYRLTGPDDLETLPWQEALFGEGVAAIEWPDRLETLLPGERWDIRIEITGDDSRTFTILAHGQTNDARSERWFDALSLIADAPVCR